MAQQTTRKSIAVLLATGNQGSSVIKSLLVSNDNDATFNIIGLTRDPASEKCEKLSSLQSISKHSLSFIKCDVHKKNELVNVFTKNKIWGVYCVTFTPFDGTTQEIQDGKACIDAAIESNVAYFILSSVVAANTEPNVADHIIAKKEMDNYLIAKCKNNDNIFVDGWTILRTTFYMENLLTFFAPKNGCLGIPVIRPNIPFAMVSITNIGDIAAAHFNQLIDCKKTNHSYDCIGDDISGDEMARILADVSGQKMQYSNNAVMLSILSKIGVHFATDLLAMFKWYDGNVVHGNKQQCYNALGDKRITFEQFAMNNFKNKNIGESTTRKAVKYITIIVAAASVVYGVLHFKK